MQRKDAATIKRARKRAKLTQRELAFLCRVSQTAIYLLEKDGPSGMDTCSDDLAIEICRRLNVDLEDLFISRLASNAAAVSTANVGGRQTA